MLTKFTCTYLPFLLSSSCQNSGISHTDKVRVIRMIYVANQYRDCVILFFFQFRDVHQFQEHQRLVRQRRELEEQNAASNDSKTCAIM